MSLLLCHPPVVIAPGPATNLTPIGATSTTISISAVKPVIGTDVRYRLKTAIHGSGVWLDNNAGTVTDDGLGNLSIAFVGLVQGTVYDVRVITYNSAGTSIADLLTGIQTATAAGGGGGTYTPPTPSQDATRFDNFVQGSSVAPGVSINIDLVLNGIGRSQAVAGTIATGPGAIGGPATFADGSTTKQTVQYTPAAGSGTAGNVEHTINFAASGGTKSLFSPDPALINVWAASSGQAQTLTATLAPTPGFTTTTGGNIGSTPRRDLATFQWRGLTTPRGFTGAIGWGAVPVAVSVGGPTNGLFARPYLGYSAGADSTPGTGTPLTGGPVQVYGPLAGGFNGVVRLHLPAWDDNFLYWDIATDAAFTNPVRIQQRFRVGILAFLMTRSQLCKMARGYPAPYEVPVGSSYTKGAIAISDDARYSDASGYHSRMDGAHGDPAFGGNRANEPSPAGGMEFCRILAGQTGFGVELSGNACTGGGLDQYLNADGSPRTAYDTLRAATDANPRYVIVAATDLDDTPIASQTLTDYTNRYTGLAAWCAVHMPSAAVIGINCGQTGYWGSDSGQQGSAPLGFTRLQVWVRDNMEAVDPRVVALEDRNWCAYYQGHATQAAGVLYSVEIARKILYADVAAARGLQTPNRGPRFGTTGIRAAGTNLIRVPIYLGGGSALRVIRINQPTDTSWSYGAAPNPDTTDLIDGVAVYDNGGRSNNGVPYQVVSVKVNTTAIPAAFTGAYATLDILVAGSAGTGTKMDSSSVLLGDTLTVQVYADSSASGGGTGTVIGNGTGYITLITNDDDPLNIGAGAPARAQLDVQIAKV